MAGEWRDCEWGDIATLEYGRSLRDYATASGTFRVYGTNGPIGWHDKVLCHHPGVIVGRKGAYRGIHYSPEPFFVIDTAFFIKPKEDLDSRWTYYALKMCDINGMDSGSAIPSTSRESFYRLPVRVPPLEEQRAITHILGTLDDKIELNRQMSETLEAMARALFKSWFVVFDPVHAKADGRDPGLPKHIADLFPDSFEDSELGEIPKGWRVGVLNDLTAFLLGGDWGADHATEDQTEAALCIRGADIPDLQRAGRGKMPVRYLKLSSIAKRRLIDGDLVIEISGGSPTQSTGRPAMVSQTLLSRLEHPLVCSNFCRVLKLKTRSMSKFVYLWLRRLYDNDEFLQYENGTTGIKNFAISLFSEKCHVVIPPIEVIEAFATITAPFFDRQQRQGAEADALAALRDTLLPKLISGELRVPNDLESLCQ